MTEMDPFKNLSMLIEKKKRNLEKKKNKLDDLKTRQKKGDQLNEDQLKSLTTYSGVVYALENVKDLCDQSMQLNQDVEKIAKKQAKRQAKEKSTDLDQKDNESTTPSEEASSIVDPPPSAIDQQPCEDPGMDTTELLIKNMVLQYKIQEVLSDLGNEAIRQCFATGSHGAIKLSSAELEFLDSLYPHINPARESLTASVFEESILTAARHSTYLFECKEMDISEVGTTYDILHDLFSRILACDFYVTGRHAAVVSEPAESSQDAAVVNGSEVHSTVNPNAAEFYPRFQVSSQPSNAYNADSNVYQNYQDNGDFYNYSQRPAATNANGPPYQPLSKVIEPLQSNFNFLQISEVDSSTTPAVVNNREATPKEVVVNSATMVLSPSGPVSVTATNKPAKSSNTNKAAYFDQSETITNYSDMTAGSTTVSKPPGLTIMQNNESGNLASKQPETTPAEAQVESGPVPSWAQLLKKNVPSPTPRVTAANLMHQAPPPAENLYQPYQKSSDVAPVRNPSGDDAGEDVFSKATDSQFLNKDNDGWISSSKAHHNRSNKPRGNNKDNQAGGPPNSRNGFRGGRPGGRGGSANTQFSGRGGNQGFNRGGFTANLKQTWT